MIISANINITPHNSNNNTELSIPVMPPVITTWLTAVCAQQAGRKAERLFTPAGISSVLKKQPPTSPIKRTAIIMKL